MEWEIRKTAYGVFLQHNGIHEGYDNHYVILVIKYIEGNVYWWQYIEKNQEWDFRWEKPEKLICPCGKEIPEEILFQFFLLEV